jgi:hypothetical protein
MPRSHPHSRKSGDPGAPPAADTGVPAGVPADDLRRQVALLAEQVRRLGAAATTSGAVADPPPPSTRSAPDAHGEPAAGPPRPRARSTAVQLPSDQEAPPAEGEPDAAHATARIDLAFARHAPDRRPVAETVQVDQFVTESAGPADTATPGAVKPVAAGSEPAAEAVRAPGEGESFAEHSSRLVESVIALAELAAIEIRASAEVEAAAIRARSHERLSSPATTQILTLVERQRRMLEALAAQTGRLEQAGAVIRAQIRALEAEHEHLSELVASARQAH